jgi:hypothetical protein
VANCSYPLPELRAILPTTATFSLGPVLLPVCNVACARIAAKTITLSAPQIVCEATVGSLLASLVCAAKLETLLKPNRPLVGIPATKRDEIFVPITTGFAVAIIAGSSIRVSTLCISLTFVVILYAIGCAHIETPP